MDLAAFDYHLPAELIAQEPLVERDRSRLLVLDRARGTIEHRVFRDLVNYLRPGDTVVVNDTRVVPARITGTRPTGGTVEALVLDAGSPGPGLQTPTVCHLLLRPAARVKPGEVLTFEEGAIRLRLLRRATDGTWLAESDTGPLAETLERVGRAPLPPYIKRPRAADPRRQHDRQRYQTVYARTPGAVAAPTAGLHFTSGLLTDLERRGIRLVRVTLHVGSGTFEPIRTDRVEDHRMHAESFQVTAAAAAALRAARAADRRIVAVGTTTVRTLETLWARHGAFRPDEGQTDLFIHPPYVFQAVDALVTNFHLPKSTLLILVAAFAGRDLVLRAYAEAVRERYRFFSYGDAMLIQ